MWKHIRNRPNIYIRHINRTNMSYTLRTIPPMGSKLERVINIIHGREMKMVVADITENNHSRRVTLITSNYYLEDTYGRSYEWTEV